MWANKQASPILQKKNVKLLFPVIAIKRDPAFRIMIQREQQWC